MDSVGRGETVHKAPIISFMTFPISLLKDEMGCVFHRKEMACRIFVVTQLLEELSVYALSVIRKLETELWPCPIYSLRVLKVHMLLHLDLFKVSLETL